DGTNKGARVGWRREIIDAVIAVTGDVIGWRHGPAIGAPIRDHERVCCGICRAYEYLQIPLANGRVRRVANVKIEVDLAVYGVESQMGEQKGAPSPARAVIELRPGRWVAIADREGAPGCLIVVHGQADLLEVVLAGGHGGSLAHSLHRRQQQADQDADDG